MEPKRSSKDRFISFCHDIYMDQSDMFVDLTVSVNMEDHHV